jgi:hypothetical protein
MRIVTMVTRMMEMDVVLRVKKKDKDALEDIG